jgi:hypothetical protein
MTVDLDLADRFVRHLQRYARGEAKAITAVDLCPALGLKPTAQARRHFRAAAHWAIENGHLICAGQRGYFAPASEDEANGTAAQLDSEADEMRKRADATRRLARRQFVLARPLPVPQDLLALLDCAAAETCVDA